MNDLAQRTALDDFTTTETTILVIDHHRSFADLLAQALNGVSGMRCVGTAATASEGIALAGKLQPDTVVLDIQMPPTHTDEGVTAARSLKARWPGLGVLLLSQHVETAHTADLLGLPGFGYLLKDRVLDVEEFVQAAERVARGGSALDPQVVSALLARRPGVSPLDRLSERELEVLELMAQGLSNAAVAGRLVLSPRTVEAHVGHLLAKLEIPDSQESHRRVLAVLTWQRGRTD
jgi:DNA-binding NarL/FixJ family response regulator